MDEILEKIMRLTETVEKNNNNGADHDLLLRISTQVERVITDVARLNDNFAGRINTLESSKVDKTSNDKIQLDHENRIRETEKFQENIIGKLTIINGIITVILIAIGAWITKIFGV